MTPPLTRANKLWYALGQGAEGLQNEALSLLLLFYYTSVLGLSGVLAGQALLIALLSDAVSDPLVGVLSDRLHSRWGRRHPFMVASAIPTAVTFALAFNPPADLSQIELFGWMATTVVAVRFCMTFFHVPHLALGAELSSDYEERTTISTLQFTFARIGAAVTGGIALLGFMRPTEAYPNGQLNPDAYAPFALTISVAMLVLILVSAWCTRSRIPYLSPPDGAASERSVVSAIFSDSAQAMRYRSFRALFFGLTMNYVAWGVTTALGLHLGTYFWQVTTAELVLWGIGAAIGIFTGLGYWHGAAARTDKKPVFIRGIALFTLFTVAPPALKMLEWWPAEGSAGYLWAWILTTGTVAHFGIAATMVTGRSMIADITDEDALAHGVRREGIFFGAISFAAKASLGVGAQIAGWVIAFVELAPRADPADVGPEVVNGLGIALISSVLVLVGFSVGVFSRYDLTRERHAGIRAALDARMLAAEPKDRIS